MTTVGHATGGWADARGRLRSNRMFVAGVSLLGLFALATVMHPVLQATVWADQQAIYRPATGHDPTISHPSGPSLAHPLGTDPLGRDGLSMVTFGLRPAFTVAIATALAAGAIGLFMGVTGAYFRGRWDWFTTHVADAFLLLPPPLVFLIASKRGLMGPLQLGLVYGIFYGLGPAAIVVRSRALAIMEKPYIEAARSVGGNARWIIVHHLVPHLMAHVAVVVLAGVVGALVTQGFVEFLGIRNYRIGLGNMVYAGLTYMTSFGTGVPWATIMSGALAISLLASSFYMISAGLREATDPRLARRRV